MFKAGGVGHVARYVVRLQFKRAMCNRRRSARGREEVVDLTLSKCVAHRTEDAHWLVARPERPAWVCVAVVQGELGFVQRGLDPAKEVVAVGHTSAWYSDCLGDSGGEGDAAPPGAKRFEDDRRASRRVPQPALDGDRFQGSGSV